MLLPGPLQNFQTKGDSTTITGTAITTQEPRKQGNGSIHPTKIL
ncbi:hypothetical protein MUK42_10720 [Musa troglodytarum]|uniref:Uncharacterized protein n=1 Tax=Musa troglodytarum TaxID=320322 RepID=A0A9E7FI76_9LILI|nr:hypothetical protein MUK42_10720 [Musa troglodytarum]